MKRPPYPKAQPSEENVYINGGKQVPVPVIMGSIFDSAEEE